MRSVTLNRKTSETDIRLKLRPDGKPEKSVIDTGVGFLDHMLTLFAMHAAVELHLVCKGDTRVDDHHSTEDTGIVLGEAFAEAIGDKKGVRRFADISLPMDEALVQVALDLSGRGACFPALSFPTEKTGTFDTELVEEFLHAFARNARLTLHVRQISGSNSHHIAEACFKGLGRALRFATEEDPRFKSRVPSTKGTL